MKKSLLGLFAVALAIGFSAFTMKSTSTRYLVFDQANSQYVEVTNFSASKCIAGAEICYYTTEEPVEVVPATIPLNQISNYTDHFTEQGADDKRYQLP